MKKNLYLYIVILFVLVMVSSGCGMLEEVTDQVEELIDEAVEEVTEEEPAEDEEDVVADKEEALFEMEQWVAPEDYRAFVDTFKELKYSVGEVDGEKMTVHYVHQGIEDVDGVETDKVELGIEGESSFVMWIDSDGEFRRLIADGEEIPREMAHMFADPFMNLVMLPFQQVVSYDIGSMVTSPVPGVKEEHVGTETATFGDLSATVYIIEISVEPPAVAEGQSGSATLHVADFGEFQMVTAWNIREVEGEAFRGKFSIDKVALR